jgi:NAD(P)H dehydrogenase (quinone)
MGMIYVTIGGKHKGLGSHEVHGGSPWGSGTVSGGDGSRQPSELELEIAQFQGYLFKKLINY